MCHMSGQRLVRLLHATAYDVEPMCPLLPYIIRAQTVEEEDEHAVNTNENSEEILCHNGEDSVWDGD